MIVKRVIFILLCLILLTGPVTAHYADISTFEPIDASKVWIIADTGQQNVIKLVAKNSTDGPLNNARVTFTLDNTLIGTISPLITSTDNNGEALCTFTVNATRPTSGTATITADVVPSDGADHKIVSWPQKIDHNVPYKAIFDYSNKVAVESVLPFKISIFDRWDNQVDYRYEIEKALPRHNLTLHLNGPTPPNDCGFTDFGLVHDKKLELDTNGEVTVSITPATKPGWHYILMEPMGSVEQQMKLFETVAGGVPFKMEQTFSPDGAPYATVLADGMSQFNFVYTLYDKYGNPTVGQSIMINITSLERVEPNQNIIVTSLEQGQVWSTHGPKSFTNKYFINATPVMNKSIFLEKTIRYYNTSASNLDVSGNPESLASRDANPLTYSIISAKVTDIMGNGVANEIVTFTLHDLTNSPVVANETKNASFSSSSKVLNASAISDALGYAKVTLYPSAYAKTTELGYKEQVTGTGIITAAWKGTQRDVKITWKNYPYLSAVVAVNPQQVKVGDTVDVSIKLNGDGWALVTRPADVVLVTDLSGSMAGSKITDTKTALTNFVNSANDRTYIALVSYGKSPGTTTTSFPYASAETVTLWNQQVANPSLKPFNPYGSFTDRCLVNPANWNSYGGSYNYHSDAKIDQDFTLVKSDLNTKIAGYTAVGGTNIAAGINGAVEEFAAHGVSSHNSTIVIMSDGQATMAPITPNSTKSYWPMDGEGSGGSGNTAKYAAIDAATRAKAAGVTIYAIGFGAGVDTATLQSIASPGAYYTATTGNLNTIYQIIAGQILTDASVDTVASMDFGTLVVNNVLTSDPLNPYFNYTANATTSPTSTMLDKYSKNSDGSIKQHFSPGLDGLNVTLPVGPITIDQTTYWIAHPQQLAFNIGTIKVNETWETNFRFKVLKEGNILIFGPNSQICFTNGLAGDSCMILPNLSLSSSMNPVNIGLGQTYLDVVGLTRTDDGLVKGTLPVTWTTTYTGNVTALIDNPVTEEISYIRDGDTPVKFETKTLTAADLYFPQSSTLYTEKLPPGGYKIRVHAYTKDASVTKECGPYSFTVQSRAFIKLE